MLLVMKKRWVQLVTPKSARNKKRGYVCDTIPEQGRQSLFDEFWLTMSWDLKNMFVCSTVDIKSTKRKTVKGDDTHEFYDSIPCEKKVDGRWRGNAEILSMQVMEETRSQQRTATSIKDALNARSYAQVATPRRNYNQNAYYQLTLNPSKPANNEPADIAQDFSDLKEAMENLKDIRKLLQEFPTTIEASKLIKKAKKKQEKILIIINALIPCPVWNGNKHAKTNPHPRSEIETSGCTDMDVNSPEGVSKRATTPPTEEMTVEDGFQLLSPQKAARGTHPEREATHVKTADMFKQLSDENIPKETTSSVPEINLKIIASCNLILKEICQQFPKTENKLRGDFISIRADTEENRQKIINILK
ncbi:hypothetical protein AVEN_107178-1 [Araneus ventricosus]|uniref:Uncharacterized protein n=1 Tax=Araneus ventricosus TaxID=182803 RepID=A0A4Y2FJJ6_ARAVE|nr:hypothetical protein AVEN_107178-1 [Araneus ventricosus]